MPSPKSHTRISISSLSLELSVKVTDWPSVNSVEEASKSNKEVIHCLETQLKEVRFRAWRVEGDLKQADELVVGYRFLLSLAELGSPGISNLLANFEGHELSLFDMIAEIRRVSAY